MSTTIIGEILKISHCINEETFQLKTAECKYQEGLVAQVTLTKVPFLDVYWQTFGKEGKLEASVLSSSGVLQRSGQTYF